jgi:hypothetical protein
LSCHHERLLRKKWAKYKFKPISDSNVRWIKDVAKLGHEQWRYQFNQKPRNFGVPPRFRNWRSGFTPLADFARRAADIAG